MTTVRLVPSVNSVSNSTYLTVTNESNMYTNVDSTTYATVNHTRQSTTSYYLYLKGFDFSQIPDNAIINSAIVKVKANVTSAGSYTPSLYNNTTSLGQSLDGTIGTTATTRTVDITSNWETYKGYGSNFGIRLQLNRSSRNIASSMRVYGAEILVDYTEAHTVTTSYSGNGSISPNGATTVQSGNSFELTITPDTNYNFTITDNSVDKTDVVASNVYTIDSVNEDHTIVVTFTEIPQEENGNYIKVNGQWKHVVTVYRKNNGAWEESVFEYDSSKKLVYLGNIEPPEPNPDDNRTFITEDMISQNPQKVTNGEAQFTVDPDTHDLSVTFSAVSQGVLINSGDLTGGDDVRVYFDSVTYNPEISDTAKAYVGLYDGDNYTNTSGMTPSIDNTHVGIQVNTSSRFVTNGGEVPITITYTNFRYEKL